MLTHIYIVSSKSLTVQLQCTFLSVYYVRCFWICRNFHSDSKVFFDYQYFNSTSYDEHTPRYCKYHISLKKNSCDNKSCITKCLVFILAKKVNATRYLCVHIQWIVFNSNIFFKKGSKNVLKCMCHKTGENLTNF